MHTIKASEFKAKCLHIMDEVNESGEEIIITQNGIPVPHLLPYRRPVHSLFGFSRDVLSSKDDLIEPTGINWDNYKCDTRYPRSGVADQMQ